jgi:4-oxalocrotonate tautomerase
MPYVNIQVTREGVTKKQKQQLIEGTTDLLVRVLGKDPKTTHIVITEIDTDNWGVAGQQVTELRKLENKGRK